MIPNSFFGQAARFTLKLFCYTQTLGVLPSPKLHVFGYKRRFRQKTHIPRPKGFCRTAKSISVGIFSTN
jgi:hypothetical protein